MSGVRLSEMCREEQSGTVERIFREIAVWSGGAFAAMMQSELQGDSGDLQAHADGARDDHPGSFIEVKLSKVSSLVLQVQTHLHQERAIQIQRKLGVQSEQHTGGVTD